MLSVSYPAAALGGLISFLSPCVLPLVPPYLSFLAGTTFDRLAAGDDRAVRRRALQAALLFVAGFTTVFVLLGATASVLGQVIRQYLWELSLVAGLGIIAMGLHFLGAFRIGLLYREARFQAPRPVGLWGAYLMGLAFAIRPFAAFMKRMRARFGLVEKAMGGLLVLTGIAFLSGWLTEASFWLLETFPALGRLG